MNTNCDDCASEMDPDSHYDDLCDACAEQDGLDGPWNWDDEAVTE